MEPLRAEDPRQVGRYRLEARVGSGGMGQVFLGFSRAGRPTAVKVVHPELARDHAFLSRFRQEVAAARKVSGAYTAAVVDAGDGDLPWLATTLVVGPSLADAVEQLGPLPEVSVWRLAAGLAEALAEVHSCGLIRRDRKPSNGLLAADGPRVIDFGISRALDGTGMTGTGMLVGTPSFMSPEQASGTPVGPASDVCSFGGVLAFAASGHGPFGDGSAVALIYRVVHGEPVLDGLPVALADLLRRCLAKRTEDRPTVAGLMDVITAHVEPVHSATSFWPPALDEFIGAYRTRITGVPRAQPPAPGHAPPPSPSPPPPPPISPPISPPPRAPVPEPVPPPAQAPPSVPPYQRTERSTYVPAEPAALQDDAPTLPQQARPTPPPSGRAPVSTPPYSSAAVPPMPYSPPGYPPGYTPPGYTPPGYPPPGYTPPGYTPPGYTPPAHTPPPPPPPPPPRRPRTLAAAPGAPAAAAL